MGLPYVSWWLVVTAVYLPVSALRGDDLVLAMLGPVWGGSLAVAPYSAYWFISALAVSALTTRIIARTRLPFVLQLLAGATLCAVVQLGAGVAADAPLAIGQGLGCALFVQIGIALRRIKVSQVGSALMIGTGIAAASLPCVTPLDIKAADFGTPVLSLVASLLICGGVVAAPVTIGVAASMWASRLAGTGIAVILGHAMLLWLLRGAVAPIWAATIALCVPWAVGLALSRTKLATVFGCVDTSGRPSHEHP